MSRFVLCIDNKSNPASLILGKVYRTLPDTDAELHNMLRVIDEDKSEPDGYLYPASIFVPIDLGVFHFSCSLGPCARFERQKHAHKGLDYDRPTHLKHTLLICLKSQNVC